MPDSSETMEQDLKNLLDGFSEPALLSEPESRRIVVANTSAVKQLGYSLATLKSSTFHELFEPNLFQGSSAPVLHVNSGTYKIAEDRLHLGGRTYYRHLLRPLKPTVSPTQLLVAREMAKVLIHRVRSPLTGVQGFVDMIDQHKADELGIDLDMINEGFGEIRSILDKLEAFTHSLEANPALIDLYRLLKDTIQMLSRKSRNRVQLDTSGGLPQLKTDYALLQSIVSELLQNAVEHSDEELAEILIETFSDGRIRITNYGQPIPKKLTQRIFIPFITTKARHLGLGLPRAVLMADKLKGHLYMTSNSAVDGIRFELKLPVKTA